MKKATIILLVLTSFSCWVFGQEIQNTSNIWYFGDNAGLDFNTSPPTALTDGQLNTQEGVASVSNSLGELLFYTDGQTIWDRTHQAMPNANGNLNGHFSSSQSALIVPAIENGNLFYVFTTDELGNNNGLAYSIVDMTLQGNGSAESPLGNTLSGQINIGLISPVSEKLTGILKADLSGYWVLTHGWDNNQFYAYEVTCDGLNPNPTISSIGNIHSGGDNNINAVGYMKASMDGQKIALVNRNNTSIDVYDFDNSTGMVTNEIVIVPNDDLIYGIEFSPNSEYLYIGGRHIISRYVFDSGNLSNIDIDNNIPISGSEVIRALQLGPDQNIYVSVRNRDFVSVIFNPNDADAELTTDGIFLNTDNEDRSCRFGLPNIFYFDLVPPDTLTLSTCSSGSIIYNGNTYMAGTVNEVHLMNSDLCDSTIILIIEEDLSSSNHILNVQACAGSFFNYNGTQIPAGLESTFTFTDFNGCDSIVTLIVEELPSDNETLIVQACIGSFFDYNGIQISAGFESTFTFTDFNGCDSIVLVIVEEVELIEQNINQELCSEETFLYSNEEYGIGTDTTFQISNPNGCDTLVLLVINEMELIEEFIVEELCAGDVYAYNNQTFDADIDTIFQFVDFNGCNNVINLLLTFNPEIDFNIIVDNSCWDTNNGSISIQNIQNGTPPFTFVIDEQTTTTEPFINNLPSDIYNIEVIDDNQCSKQQEIEINDISEFTTDYEEAILSCEDDSVLVAVNLININTEEVSWNWENGSENNFIYASQPGLYSLVISNECQTLVEEISVQLEEDLRQDFVYIPNIISANQDGINDVFQVFPRTDIEIINFEINIFDRWGSHLYKSNDVNFSWDGEFKDSPLKTGVYTWFFKMDLIACKQDIQIFKEGDITIIR